MRTVTVMKITATACLMLCILSATRGATAERIELHAHGFVGCISLHHFKVAFSISDNENNDSLLGRNIGYFVASGQCRIFDQGESVMLVTRSSDGKYCIVAEEADDQHKDWAL